MPRGQHNAAKTHCPRNHEYTPENTLLHGKEKKRRCRTCARANSVIQNIKRYGLTPEKIQEMLEEQDFNCPCCLRSFLYLTPHVDHDHACCPGHTSCGECVRGLLCQDCNRMLGQAHDRISTLRRAAEYLVAAGR